MIFFLRNINNWVYCFAHSKRIPTLAIVYI